MAQRESGELCIFANSASRVETGTYAIILAFRSSSFRHTVEISRFKAAIYTAFDQEVCASGLKHAFL